MVGFWLPCTTAAVMCCVINTSRPTQTRAHYSSDSLSASTHTHILYVYIIILYGWLYDVCSMVPTYIIINIMRVHDNPYNNNYHRYTPPPPPSCEVYNMYTHTHTLYDVLLYILYLYTSAHYCMYVYIYYIIYTYEMCVVWRIVYVYGPPRLPRRAIRRPRAYIYMCIYSDPTGYAVIQ